ncbi:MAG: MerR family transcriptional regulator [Muribaculaceae bacterium]|nr:MerR family transcriptional regulator [Muribaculaceae bacterium]
MEGERSEYPKKQFYSISEVAEIVGTNESTLRFWEREFKEIKPRRASRGIRLYSNADLQIVKLIYHLVKEKGLTLDGAKKRLKENSAKENSIMEVMNRLKEVRAELLAIRNYIDFLETEERERALQKETKKTVSEPQQTYVEVSEEEMLAEESVVDIAFEEEEPKTTTPLSLF